MIYSFTLSFVTIATFYMYNVAAECYAYSGPDGSSKECKKLSRYNDYQWVTCASDSYVRERTNGKYHCLLGSYCTFDCMVELYDKHSGDVKGICQCSPGDTPPRTLPTAAINSEKMLQCSADSGPGGHKECVKESGYNDYQWVTCASDSYVREKSSGSYRCLIGSYCRFTCMTEVYHRSSGDVKGICQCSPGDIPPTAFGSAASHTIMNALLFVVPLIASFTLISL